MYLLIVMSFFVISSITLISQNEDGIRNVDFLPKQPPFSAFHTGIPIIQSVPPLSLSMPYDVLLGYIALDSISRFYNDSIFRVIRGQSLDQALENLNPTNDTLHTIWKYLYRMVDYDPIKFHQYLHEQMLSPNENYYFRFYGKHRWLLSKAFDLNNPLKNRIASALIPMYVLKVNVVDIDSMKAPVIFYGDTSKYKYYNITCNVLDTLKGKVIPLKNTQQNIVNKKIENSKSSNGTFSFVISTNSYPQTRLQTDLINYPYPLIDSLIFDDDKKIMRLKVGQELVVFLTCGNELFTKTHDYFQFFESSLSSNGILPIINGMVSDVNKIWSDSTWIPYETWKEKYNEVVDMIMSKKY